MYYARLPRWLIYILPISRGLLSPSLDIALVDILFGCLLATGYLYITYKVHSNKKAGEYLRNINQHGGTVALIAIGIFVLIVVVISLFTS